jgi:hypothetical protein
MPQQNNRATHRRLGGHRKSRIRVGPLPWIILAVICLLAAILGSWVDRAIHDWEETHHSTEQD